MQFKFIIILLAGIPILVSFLCGIASQIIALHYLNGYIEQHAQNLFQDQQMYYKYMSLSTSIKMSTSLQHIPYNLNLINSFYSKILNDQVKINKDYRPSIINFFEFVQNKGDPYLLELSKKNPSLLNFWILQDKHTYQELDDFQKIQLKNATLVDYLVRSISFSNNNDLDSSFYNLNYTTLFSGYTETGLVYSSKANTTYQQEQSLICDQNQKFYDPRCQFWFLNTLNQESTVFHPPQILYLENIPFLGQLSCQKLVYYNQNLKQDQVDHVFCFSIKISEFQNFLSEYQSKQMMLFVFDPNSYTIVFDSTDTLDYQQANNLFQKYPLNTTEQMMIKRYIEDCQAIEKERFDRVNLTDLIDIHSNPVSAVQYFNGTNQYIFQNPVYIIDKLPKYISSINNKNSQKFKYKFMYLQTGAVTDSKIRQQSNEVLEYSQKLTIAISLTMFILIIFFTLISIYYSLFINNLLHKPIVKMTKILKRLQNQKRQNNFYFVLSQINFDKQDIFLSKEIYNLSISINQVFQLLLQISQNYYKSNLAETLIRLSNNISFFKQSQNYYALGITHNNIGSILLNQEHYIQSLEHFESSIIYARYEIQEFCVQHPNSNCIEFLRQYCYEEQFERLILYPKKQRKQSIDSVIEEELSSRNYSIPNKNSLKENQNSNVCIQKKEPSIFSRFFHHKNSKPEQKIDKKSNTQSPKQSNFKKIELVDIFGNYLFTEQDEDNMLLHLQEDEFYEYGISMVLNIFYRKYNYAFALLRLQSSYEENNKLQKKSQNAQMLFNYWNEIKNRFKELISIAQSLHLSQHHLLILNSHLKKCYNRMNKKHKIDILNEKMRNLMSQYVQRIYKTNSNLTLLSPHNIEEMTQKGKIFEEEAEQLQGSLRKVSKRKNNGSSGSLLKIKRKTHSILKRHTQQSSQDNIQNLMSYLDISETKQNTQQISSPHRKKINKQMRQSIQQDNERILQFQQEDQNNLYIDNKYSQGQIDMSPSSYNKQRQHTKNNILRLNQGNLKNISQVGFEMSEGNLKKMYIKNRYEDFALKQTKVFNQLQRKKILVDNVEIISKICQVDILISENQYVEAAEILTSIIENSNALLSHYSFMILRRLKDIFIHYGIYSKDLDYMHRKFNKNIHMDICIIYNTSEKHENWLWTFFLTKELLSKILNQKNDTFSVLEIIEDLNQVIEIINQIPLKQIEKVIHPFLDSMLETYLNQHNQNFQKLIQRFDTCNNYNINNNNNNQNNFETFQNTSQIIDRIQLSPIKSEQKIEVQINNKKELKEAPQTQAQFNSFLVDQAVNKFSINNPKSNTYSEGTEQNRVENNQNLNDTKKMITSQNKLLNSKIQISETSPINQQLNSFMFNQFQFHEGDFYELSSSSSSTELNPEFYQQSNSNRIIQNSYFHLAVRKALQQLLTTQQVTFQASTQNFNSDQQNDKSNQQDQPFQNQSFQENDLFTKNYYLEIKYKFIIFSTKNIQIIQNSLFEELCKILSKYSIQILIISMEKGSNFLEKQLDLIYWYNDKHIIRIFYEIQQLLNYINSKRDPFQKEAQITFIQHY